MMHRCWQLKKFIEWQLLAACLAITGMLGGCTNGYNGKAKSFLTSYEAGDMQAACEQVVPKATKSGGTNALLYHLEAGAVLRSAGQYKESNNFFEKAEEIVAEYDNKAKVSVTDTSKAAVTNLSFLPYRGYDYDRVMMDTFKALNYLHLGDNDRVAVELNRAYNRQQEAVASNSKRIEKAKEKADEKEREAAEKAEKDPKFQADLAEQYGDLKQYHAYADYINPFTEFLQGLYFMTAGVDASDFERATKSMQRVGGMVPGNQYILEDMAAAEQVANGAPLPALTYVVFATGLAPHRDSIRIDLPIFIAGKYSGGVDYVGASFPRLVFNDSYVQILKVATATTQFNTSLICDMDAVIAQDFQNELPIVITQTVINTVIKAAAAYALNKGTENNVYANLIARVAAGIYQVGMNQADLRTWLTLPKQFQYCRFPTPADRTVQIESPQGGTAQTIQLIPGKVNVIYVRSITPTTPLIVSQFVLSSNNTPVAATGGVSP